MVYHESNQSTSGRFPQRRGKLIKTYLKRSNPIIHLPKQGISETPMDVTLSGVSWTKISSRGWHRFKLIDTGSTSMTRRALVIDRTFLISSFGKENNNTILYYLAAANYIEWYSNWPMLCNCSQLEGEQKWYFD